MKRTDPQSIRQIIEQYLRADGLEEKVLHQRASYVWPEVVGPGINRYTVRRFVADDGVMHVFLTSASLKNELSFHRTRLVEAINAAVGRQAITDIVIH